MRRRLAVIVLAVTGMVTIAFLVPLALVVRVVAADRAVSAADQESRSLAGVLAAVPDRAAITAVLDQLNTDNPRQATVFLSSGAPIGAPLKSPSGELAQARSGRAFTASGPGDERRVWVAEAEPDGAVAVAVIAVPARLVDQGVYRAWALLALVGAVAILLGVALADRLGRTMVGPVQDLEQVTERIRDGDLEARVEPRGPPEIADVGRAVNHLADRIGDLISQEREAAADLSHQLRTPLTVVQLEADSISDPQERSRVAAAVGALTDAVTAVINESRRPRRSAASEPSADLVATVQRRMAFWSVVGDEQGRHHHITLPDAPCLVRVEQGELTAVVDAILTNVFTHTPPSASFAVTVEAGDPLPRLRVDDTGPGIPQAPRRGRSASGSTGLGLDIVRRAAERSGGSLRCGRAGGKGGARVEVHFGRPRRAGGAPQPLPAMVHE